GGGRPLRERSRHRVVPGRAAEPGCLVPDRALFPREHARRPEAVLRRSAGFGVARRRLHGAAQRTAEDPGGAGIREIQVNSVDSPTRRVTRWFFSTRWMLSGSRGKTEREK